jgi:hypothetical protein
VFEREQKKKKRGGGEQCLRVATEEISKKKAKKIKKI